MAKRKFAREAILEAAEKRLIADGPGGLRLQEIANDVGVSHPAVLHHFGSREGLVGAVVERAFNKLQADLMVAVTDADGPALFERVAHTYRTHARLLAWLVLSGSQPEDSAELRKGFRKIVKTTHDMRPNPRASPEDTAFAVSLSALALFANALIGPQTFELAGVGRNADKKFRRWLAGLLAQHLSQ